ncbi:hypothetical protein BJV82DRAFT_661233 [Fennellomyces sp. T-0311]|nr:hypothetical protein BJV82DRAFT_661233 [Fennellomyces sp. T-0311]
MPEKRHAQDLESPPKRTANASLDSVIAITTTALDNPQFDFAIEQVSTAFNGLAKSMVKLLELRAQAWSKKAKNAEELKDALTMINIAPDCASGYLCAGRLYSMLGYQGAAMDTLKEGLDRILPSDRNYVTIQHEYEKAKTRSQRRIDFVDQLPYELIPYITNHFTHDVVLASATVSRAWRIKLLGNPSEWKEFNVEIKLDEGDTGTYIGQPFRMLPAVAHYVEQLSLDAQPTIMRNFLKLFQSHEFPRLQGLAISNISEYRQANNALDKPFFHALEKIGDALTQLSIERLDVLLPSLSVILSVFRNMAVLNLSKIHLIPVFFSGLTGLHHTTRLTTLTLWFPDIDIPLHEIDALIRCSPSLIHIDIGKCNGDVLSTIVHRCPDLATLSLNKSERFAGHPSWSNTSPSGFHQLVLGGEFSTAPVHSLLETKYATLQSLYLAPEESDTTLQDWSLLSGFRMKSLIDLHLEGSNSTFHTLIAPIIRQCPALQEIDLGLFETGITDEVFDAMAGLKHLDILRLNNVLLNELRSPNLIRRLHISLLGFYACLGVTDDILRAASSIETLGLWDIQGSDDVSESGVNDLTESLAKLPVLKRISLADLHVTDEAALKLCSSKCLRTVEILEGTYISEEAIQIVRNHGIDIYSPYVN